MKIKDYDIISKCRLNSNDVEQLEKVVEEVKAAVVGGGITIEGSIGNININNAVIEVSNVDYCCVDAVLVKFSGINVTGIRNNNCSINDYSFALASYSGKLETMLLVEVNYKRVGALLHHERLKGTYIDRIELKELDQLESDLNMYTAEALLLNSITYVKTKAGAPFKDLKKNLTSHLSDFYVTSGRFSISLYGVNTHVDLWYSCDLHCTGYEAVTLETLQDVIEKKKSYLNDSIEATEKKLSMLHSNYVEACKAYEKIKSIVEGLNPDSNKLLKSILDSNGRLLW